MITTCVILNYNDSDTTISLLNKIKNFNSIDSIVVVDNCSTDNSFLKLKKYESKKIHIIKTECNGGYGYGNNYGIKYAYYTLKASYILIANPDVDFDNKCIFKLKETLEFHTECAIVAAREYNDKWLNAWKMPNVFQDILTFGMISSYLIKLQYSNDYINKDDVCYVDVVSGSMLLIDAEKMINYGMYDEDIFLYEEEKVLALKFKQYGFKTMLLTNSRYYHHHSISISKTYKSYLKQKKLQMSSKIITLKKYRNLNSISICLAKVFFYIILGEIVIYSALKKFKYNKKEV